MPDSSFVMLQNAEHMEEIYGPLSVPSVRDVLTAEKIVEIEQATVGQAENPLWHALPKGRITASNFEYIDLARAKSEAPINKFII